MAQILLTGGTGALGSSILKLLAPHHTVWCLARSKGGVSAHERIYRVTRPTSDGPNLNVIDGDITQPNCGIADDTLDNLKRFIDIIVHCAASIDFANEQEALTTNVVGLANILNVAHRLEVRDFRHVSTAYVAGDSLRFTEADLAKGQKFRNPYEQSKWTGEQMVHAWHGGSFSIYRPSILIGREDGTSPTFDGYYGFFRPIHSVAQALRRSASQGKQLPSDLIVLPDGTVEFKFAIQASYTSTLNLVPIDWVASMMAGLISLPSKNKTYHLTHPSPPLVSDVIYDSLRSLQVRGAHIVQTPEELTAITQKHSPLASRLQRQITNVLEHFVPYVTCQPVFDTRGIRTDLGSTYREPRPITSSFLADLLAFAITQNWDTRKESRA